VSREEWQLRIALADALSSAIRWVVGRRHAAILVYHKIDYELFEAHVERLMQLYHIVPLDRLVHAIRRRDWSEMPPQSLVITFDDGHKSFAHLEPVIRRYELPVTQFLVSGGVGTNRHCWTSEVAAEHKNGLKRMNREKRLDWLRRNLGYEPGIEYPDREMLNREEIHCLMRAGVQFGAHTITHEELTTCSDGVAQCEVLGSKSQLEDMLGVPIAHFAYPSGSYSMRDVEYVRQAGFCSARTMDRGWNGIDSDCFRLKDIGPGDGLTVSQLGHLELISMLRRVEKALERTKECVKTPLRMLRGDNQAKYKGRL
jgi:peptidoglycan/xylan/chitin deacetylase (PgdA/CDA1 family)